MIKYFKTQQEIEAETDNSKVLYLHADSSSRSMKILNQLVIVFYLIYFFVKAAEFTLRATFSI